MQYSSTLLHAGHKSSASNNGPTSRGYQLGKKVANPELQARRNLKVISL